jgi:hypothetical protein
MIRAWRTIGCASREFQREVDIGVGRVWITDVAVGLSQLEIRLDKLAADGWRVEAVVPIGGRRS